MPLFKKFEFALVSVDDEPCDLADTGRFRIIEEGGATTMEIKDCRSENWRKPGAEDLRIFRKVLEQYRG